MPVSPNSQPGSLPRIEPPSLVQAGDATFGIASDAGGSLVIQAPTSSSVLDQFEGSREHSGASTTLTAQRTATNATALRQVFPWLQPVPLGLRTSIGFGDRLGLATPGHIRAMRAAGGNLAPIFAQQSIREMVRTNRTAQEIVDAAMWDVFAHGWRSGYGADADHLKTPADIDTCVAAGYTFYTFDPSDHVASAPPDLNPTDLATRFESLPWDELETSAQETRNRYAGRTFDIEGHQIVLDDAAVMRASIKYGRAIAHVRLLTDHLRASLPSTACEIEISVDETDDPTSPAEHIFIASELQRAGVPWVSLAPRFTGHFEKGVDYIGDIDAFTSDFAIHAAIARHFGPYKLSLHSGSDKFSIYDITARLTRDCVHLKTAGTSFLEALRVIAGYDPDVFRRLYTLARTRFETDRASYHISGRLDHAPEESSLADAELPGLLDQFDARQILHVTFGSQLTSNDPVTGLAFRDEIDRVLRDQPEAYAATLEQHFLRHLQPFAAHSTGQ